jgi:sugar/nucleoside kinase (ribokinase family)
MFEIYYFDDEPLHAELREQIDEEIAARAADYDVVIVNDFGHGLIAPSTIQALSRTARFLAVNAQSNSANMGFNLITRYPRADYVCIDAPEARLATGDKHLEIERVVGESLPARIDCEKFIITQGAKGCVTYSRGGALQIIPALTQTVVDTVGAGDAFLAITAPLVMAGGYLRDIGFVGNMAGALKVNIVGHRSSVEKPALVKAIASLLK